MTPLNMREFVSKAYPGDKWKRKVQKMSDAQVAAIYWRLVRQAQTNVH